MRAGSRCMARMRPGFSVGFYRFGPLPSPDGDDKTPSRRSWFSSGAVPAGVLAPVRPAGRRCVFSLRHKYQTRIIRFSSGKQAVLLHEPVVVGSAQLFTCPLNSRNSERQNARRLTPRHPNLFRREFKNNRNPLVTSKKPQKRSKNRYYTF